MEPAPVVQAQPAGRDSRQWELRKLGELATPLAETASGELCQPVADGWRQAGSGQGLSDAAAGFRL